MTKVTPRHLWQAISISVFCYLPGGENKPSSGRKVARASVTEGACVSLRLAIVYTLRTLPQSPTSPVSSRREPDVAPSLSVSTKARISLSLSQRVSRKEDRERKTFSAFFLSVDAQLYCFFKTVL